MIVSYLTVFPLHQPAGPVTEATEETSPSSVLSGSVILAASPGLMRPTMDSGISTCTCILARSGKAGDYPSSQSGTVAKVLSKQ